MIGNTMFDFKISAEDIKDVIVGRIGTNDLVETCETMDGFTARPTTVEIIVGNLMGEVNQSGLSRTLTLKGLERQYRRFMADEQHICLYTKAKYDQMLMKNAGLA